MKTDRDRLTDGRQPDRQAERQTDRQTDLIDSPPDRQTDRQIDRLAIIYSRRASPCPLRACVQVSTDRPTE